VSTIYTSDVTVATATRTKILDVDMGGVYPLSFLTLSSSANTIWEIFLDQRVNALSVPGNPTLTASTTGGTIPRSTKLYVRVTTIDVNGLEGPPSTGMVSVTTGSGTDTNKVTISWSAVTGSSGGYNVYVGLRPGSESLVTQVAGTSYVLTALSSDAVVGTQIPTMPIVVQGKSGGADTIPFGAPPQVGDVIIVYATPSATNTRVTISVSVG
jgi:hypothetical protein